MSIDCQTKSWLGHLSQDWKTFDIVSRASSAPVICDPHVSDPITLTPDHAFAFLMSDGVYDAISIFSDCDKQAANAVLANHIYAKLKEGKPASQAAEEIQDWIVSEQQKACQRGHAKCNRLDDLTLMIIPFKTPS